MVDGTVLFSGITVNVAGRQRATTAAAAEEDGECVMKTSSGTGLEVGL
jgi:hypothetical protein